MNEFRQYLFTKIKSTIKNCTQTKDTLLCAYLQSVKQCDFGFKFSTIREAGAGLDDCDKLVG